MGSRRGADYAEYLTHKVMYFNLCALCALCASA